MKMRFGVAAGIFLAIFALYPQMKLWYVRGGEWQGNYAYNDIDEVAYASYLKALIDGRPRKNDPYTGRDDTPDAPQPESLFSIQFAAPYTLAIPARVLGLSAPWMMTIGGALAAFLTAFIIFWILYQLTENNWFSMAGSLVTLAGGSVFAGEGAMLEIFFDGFSYPYFPGFRRYIPALAMPAFFAFVGLVWKLIGSDRERDTGALRHEAFYLAAASIAFAYTVFSYFYIWTTAAAWLGCLITCWLISRPVGVWIDLKRLGILASACVLVLIPYAYLLSHRSQSLDDVQLLVRTRSLDLARFPEYISLVVVIILAVGILLKIIDIRSRRTLFVLSLTVVSFAIFNQQLITGQSLQPIHYQVFIGNYVAGLALVAAVGLFVREGRWSRTPAASAAFAALAGFAILWGSIECHYTVRVLDEVNLVRDEQVPLARRLVELAKNDPAPNKTVVLHFGIAEADDLPTLAPQATLWSRHQHVFPGLSHQENKERYYQYLYYQGVTEDQLARSMKEGDFVSMIALFGWGRHTDRLNSEYKPLTYGEIDHEARVYGEYISRFDPRDRPESIPEYLVVSGEGDAGLERIDKWFIRDGGERFGRYTLFRLKLRGEAVQHDSNLIDK